AARAAVQRLRLRARVKSRRTSTPTSWSLGKSWSRARVCSGERTVTTFRAEAARFAPPGRSVGRRAAWFHGRDSQYSASWARSAAWARRSRRSDHSLKEVVLGGSETTAPLAAWS